MLPPLAELHLHLGGCLSAATILEQLLRYEELIDLGPYEDAYEAAFGVAPSLRAILPACRAGDPEARAAFAALFVFGDADAGNFARFQAKFNLIIAATTFRRQPGPSLAALADENFERLVASVLHDEARQGIAYAEQRFVLSSEPHAVGWPEFLRAFQHGRARAAAAGPTPTLRLAPSLPRANPWPQWEVVQRLVLGDGGEICTGIDFCFIEEGFPPKDKASFFAAVREHNDRHPERALALLYHVGESFTDKSLESAVRWVQEAAEQGAHRLGHAIALGIEPAAIGTHQRFESAAERIDQLRYDLAHADGLERHGVIIDRAATAAELRRLELGPRETRVEHVYTTARLDEVRRRQDYAMHRVKRTGAVIEVCPTSNRRIGALVDPAHHPVHRFLAAGLNVVIASDDPGIFGVTLAEELSWVTEHAALAPEEVRALREAMWRSRSEVLTGRDTIDRRGAR
jgi:adenosine deaminase